MSEQLPLKLGRGPMASPLHQTAFGDRVFSVCTSGYLRLDVWAYEYKLRMILPERPAWAHTDRLDDEGDPIFLPTWASKAAWRRPTWAAAVPTIVTETESWLAGSRGNAPEQVKLEIINTAFFPWERLRLLDWIANGCSLEGDEHEQDLRSDLDGWFRYQISTKHNLSPELEASLRRVPLQEHVRENLLYNLFSYREAHKSP